MTARFLFLNQFYPPDVAPTGRFLHDLARTLVDRGQDVQIICSRRGYATGEDLGPGGVVDGVKVTRVAASPARGRSLLGRAAENAIYLLRAVQQARALEPRPDLVLAATSPPLVGMALVLAARRGSIRAHWTMDLYPDVLLAHWGLESGSLAASLFSTMGRFQFRRSALVVAIGGHMARRVERYLDGQARLEAIPLWSDVDPDLAAQAHALRAARHWRPDELVLMYSGNMGRGHRFAEFLETSRRLGPAGPVWAFQGGGPRRGELAAFRERYPEARVQLLPYVPDQDLGASLRAADVHLVSLAASWQGVIVPSKLQAAFATARPVIFVGPSNNEAAAWITESKGGWVVAEGDIDGLMAAVRASADPQERALRGRAGQQYAQLHFSREHNCGRMADLLEGCLDPTGGNTQRPTRFPGHRS
jgi:colanic acid biosynthesis glycosyl transferase WcaI